MSKLTQCFAVLLDLMHSIQNPVIRYNSKMTDSTSYNWNVWLKCTRETSLSPGKHAQKSLWACPSAPRWRSSHYRCTPWTLEGYTPSASPALCGSKQKCVWRYSVKDKSLYRINQSLRKWFLGCTVYYHRTSFEVTFSRSFCIIISLNRVLMSLSVLSRSVGLKK